jgi:RNA polymerase sigma-70 factor (ECF subfamily)
MVVRESTPNTQTPDRDAGAIFDATLSKIYGSLLIRLGNDRQTAEDLTQETYLSLAAQIRQGRTPPEPLPWLLHVARNKLIDHYRRMGRTRERFAPWQEDGPEPPDPGTPFSTVNDRDQIARALAHLPESQRLAIVLHYLDDLPIPQVAAALGKSPSAIESLLARGRAGMRTALNRPEDTR